MCQIVRRVLDLETSTNTSFPPYIEKQHIGRPLHSPSKSNMAACQILGRKCIDKNTACHFLGRKCWCNGHFKFCMNNKIFKIWLCFGQKSYLMTGSKRIYLFLICHWAEKKIIVRQCQTRCKCIKIRADEDYFVRHCIPICANNM